MLTAITCGKAGRVRLPGSDMDLTWREVFRAREDLLTAVYFSRLRYLSEAALLRAMAALVGDAAAGLGPWTGIKFWPRLERLDGRSWVEPDVLLSFERALVMVEVKPPFGGEQSVAQWQAELDALLAEVRDDESRRVGVVHFVALGRTSRVRADALAQFDAEGLFDLQVHCVEWHELAQLLPAWAADSPRPDAAVFEDWIAAFELFGVQVRQPREWAPLSGWAGANTFAADLLHLWPLGQAVDSLVLKEAPGWDALLDYSELHPMEFESWR